MLSFRSTLWVTVGLVLLPLPTAGQDRGRQAVVLPSVRATEESPESFDLRFGTRVDSIVRAALALPKEERFPKAALADSIARAFVHARPESAEARHWHAVAAGVLAEISGTNEKIRLGRLAYEEASLAIEWDPEHAGGHHVVGRIHAGVSRLSWISRFFASRMGMGDVINAASWEEAEVHMRRAVELAPDEITYRLELAVLLLHRDRVDQAKEHLTVLLRATARDELERRSLDRARELLAEVESDRPQPLVSAFALSNELAR